MALLVGGQSHESLIRCYIAYNFSRHHCNGANDAFARDRRMPAFGLPQR